VGRDAAARVTLRWCWVRTRFI